MEKINIDGKEVRLRATAAVPRLYRIKFGCTSCRIWQNLPPPTKATTEQEQLAATDLGLLESAAHHGKARGRGRRTCSVEEWLNSLRFSTLPSAAGDP